MRKFLAPSPGRSSEVQDMAFLAVLTTQLLHRQYIECFAERRPAPAIPDRIVEEPDRHPPLAAAG